MRNQFLDYCLLIQLLRKARIKILKRLLRPGVKIFVAVGDGNIGEIHK